jgi:hypothetical protein
MRLARWYLFLVGAVLSAPLQAAPITYAVSTVASGQIGGTEFSDKTVTITVTADTDGITPVSGDPGSAEYNPGIPLSDTITVGGDLHGSVVLDSVEAGPGTFALAGPALLNGSHGPGFYVLQPFISLNNVALSNSNLYGTNAPVFSSGPIFGDNGVSVFTVNGVPVPDAPNGTPIIPTVQFGGGVLILPQNSTDGYSFDGFTWHSIDDPYSIVLSATSQVAPVLPTTTQPSGTCLLIANGPVVPGCVPVGPEWVFGEGPSGAWFDPTGAGGYIYSMSGDSLFTDILSLPTGFANPFTISSPGCTIPGTYTGGDSVDFVSLCGQGVSSFAISDISPAVDPDTPNAFPIELAFNTPTADFNVQGFDLGNSVPEPPSETVLGFTLVAVYAAASRKRSGRTRRAVRGRAG